MKWFIASDIHGSAYYCRRMLERYKKRECRPPASARRRALSRPAQRPAEWLRAQKRSLKCSMLSRMIYSACAATARRRLTRMVLKFPVLADYAIIDLGDSLIYATHGHIYNENNLPPLKRGDVLLHGHTHIPECTEHENYIYMNPGSSRYRKRTAITAT